MRTIAVSSMLIMLGFCGNAMAYDAVCKEQPHKPKTKHAKKTVAVQTPTDGDNTKLHSSSTNRSVQNSTTGNQTVIVNAQPAQPVTRVIIREHVVYRQAPVNQDQTPTVYPSNQNRLQLLLGVSNTKMSVVEQTPETLVVNKVYEPDFGIQYIRDFSRFTGSISGTLNRNFYVGVGVNW